MDFEKADKEYDIIETEIKQLKHKKRNQRKIRNKAFRKRHNISFKIFDICILIIILFNLGALLITNMLVVKENPAKEFKEANKVQADLNGYEYHEGGNDVMNALLIQSVVWAIIIGGYLFLRFNSYKYFDLINLMFIILFYLAITATDFVNDFGYLLGKIFWG